MYKPSTKLETLLLNLEQTLADTEAEFGEDSFEVIEMQLDNQRVMSIETVCIDFNQPGGSKGLEVFQIMKDAQDQEEAACMGKTARVLEAYAQRGVNAPSQFEMSKIVNRFRGLKKGVTPHEEILEIRKDRDAATGCFHPSWSAKVWAAMSSIKDQMKDHRDGGWVESIEAFEELESRLSSAQ